MKTNPQLTTYLNIIRNNIVDICGGRSYPRFAHFFITWKCNLKCRECSIWQKKDSLQLDTDAVIAVIKKMPFLDTIKITGGEPFTREDLPEIVSGIRANINPYIIQVTTNGTYTERIVEFVKQSYSSNLHLRISLDGTEKVHDKIRGVKGCYQKAQKTILALLNLKRKYPFRLGINYGLRKESIPFLTKMFEFCKTNKIGLIIGYPIKPFIEDTNFNTSGVNIEIPEDIVNVYKKFVFFQKTTGNSLETIFTNFLNKLFFKKELLGKFRFDCGELRDLVYILPNADVVMCGLRQKKVANLLEDDFKNIWFSKKIEKFKKEVRDCPGCAQKSIKLFSKIYKFL